MSSQTESSTSVQKPPAISKEDFLSKAAPERVLMRDQVLYLVPKAFSTGSYGWSCTDRMTMLVDGKPVPVFANMIITVAGSKPPGAQAPTQTPPVAVLPDQASSSSEEHPSRKHLK